MLQLFYTPDILDGSLTLSETESQHCVKVLRRKVGDDLILVDGQGGWYEASITQLHPKHCEFQILSTQKNYQKPKIDIHIAIAPPKNNARFEWFLEKSTEIGISQVTPIVTKYAQRDRLRTDRLQKIIISAMKQSLKAYLPVLQPITSFGDFLASYKNDSHYTHKYIATLLQDFDTPTLKTAYTQTANTLVLIGPEGGFAAAEVEQALRQGFQAVSLGNNRLRTETAGIAACHAINLLSE